MPIILEGPENSGKSTLAEALLHELQFDGIRDPMAEHHGRYPEERNVFCRYTAGATAGDDVIMDRSWYSEAIYGHLMRGYDRLGVNARSLDRAAIASKSVVVRCLPDRALCIGLGDEYVHDEPRRARVYDAFAAWTPAIPSLDFDWREHTARDVLRRVNLRRAAMRTPPPLGSGNWTNPKVVLVGDRPNYMPGHAFVADKGCTAWLNGLLDESLISEMDLAWVNAKDLSGHPSRWPELPTGAKLVALGGEADAWIERHRPEAEFLRFDHPQYHRRFNAGHDYPLIEYLEDVCFQ